MLRLMKFVSQLYMGGFYFLTEPKVTVDRVKVEYRLGRVYAMFRYLSSAEVGIFNSKK